MTIQNRLILFLLVSVGFGLNYGIRPPTVQAIDHTISYTNTGFSPKTLSITVGDTVYFNNNSSSVLDLASDPHPTHTDYPALNVGVLAASGGSTSLTFNTTGTWGYHNHLFASHNGTITVQLTSTTTDTSTATDSAEIRTYTSTPQNDGTLDEAGTVEWTIALLGAGVVLLGGGFLIKIRNNLNEVRSIENP